MEHSANLFQKSLSMVPEDLKCEIDLSFAIADKIDDTLKQRGITQKEFANRCGKTEAEMSRWLSGTHNFTLRTLAKISTTLDRELVKV